MLNSYITLSIAAILLALAGAIWTPSTAALWRHHHVDAQQVAEPEGESKPKQPGLLSVTTRAGEVRWRVVDDPTAGESPLLSEADAAWLAPMLAGHQFLGISGHLPADWSGSPPAGVYATLDTEMVADPLWLRRRTVEGYTDSSGWGRQELFFGQRRMAPPENRSVEDALRWNRITHVRAPSVHPEGNVPWDVPHSPFVVPMMMWSYDHSASPRSQPALLHLRYRREYDGAQERWRYWTEVTDGGAGEPLATVEGLVDSPAAWGHLLLLRRHGVAGLSPAIVALPVKLHRFRGSGLYGSDFAEGLGEVIELLQAREGEEFLPPVWLEAQVPFGLQGELSGKFAVVTGQPDENAGSVTGQLKIVTVDTSLAVGKEAFVAIGSKRMLATLQSQVAEVVARGRFPAGPMLDAVSYVEDRWHYGRSSWGRGALETWNRRAEAPRHSAILGGLRPPAELLEQLPKQIGGTLAVVRLGEGERANAYITQYRLQASTKLGEVKVTRRQAISDEQEESEMLPAVVFGESSGPVETARSQSFPLAGIWANTAAQGQADFEVLAGGRVWKLLSDGRLALPADFAGSAGPKLPAPASPKGTVPVALGARGIGGGEVLVWWAAVPVGDDGAAPTVQDAIRAAQTSRDNIIWQVIGDGELGLLWPDGAPGALPRGDSMVAKGQTVPHTWVAENVLQAKRIAAASAAGRLTNTVLAYSFDVKVEAEGIANKRGTVLEIYRAVGRPMLRMEDDFSGQWTVKAYDSGTGTNRNPERAWLAGDAAGEREFRVTEGNTKEDLAGLVRARRLLLLLDAGTNGSDAFSAVGYAAGLLRDPATGQAHNTWHFVRQFEDGSEAQYFFDADGEEHHSIMVRLAFPIASRTGEGKDSGHSSIDLWLDNWRELPDIGAATGKRAEPLLVPGRVRGFAPGSAELRFEATFLEQVTRNSYLSGRQPIRSGFGWDAIQSGHFGRVWALDGSE